MQRWLRLTVILVSTSAACSIINGLDDFEHIEGDRPTGGTGAAGGTGGAGLTGSTSTGAGGGQAGTGGTGSEDCLDGMDNDGDAAVDCADADCGPVVECVDAAPGGGWSGSIRVARVPYPAVDPAPSCADGSTPLTYFSGPAGPALCSNCDCTFMGASCTTPDLQCWFAQIDCTGGNDIAFTATNTNCVGNPSTPGSGVGSCKQTAPSQVQSQGTCGATGGASMNQNTWTEEVYVCATPGVQGGCAAGQVCTPKAPVGFDTTACIRKDEDLQGCPAGWTDGEIQAYDSAIDTRDCVGCACSVASVTCTGGGLLVYDSDNCASVGVAVTSNCQDVSGEIDNDTFSYRGTLGSPTPGTCTQASPTGSVQTTGPVHLCCQLP